jgi:hypothetical protein
VLRLRGAKLCSVRLSDESSREHRLVEQTSIEGGRGHAVGLYCPLNDAGTPSTNPTGGAATCRLVRTRACSCATLKGPRFSVFLRIGPAHIRRPTSRSTGCAMAIPRSSICRRCLGAHWQAASVYTDDRRIDQLTRLRGLLSETGEDMNKLLFGFFTSRSRCSCPCGGPFYFQRHPGADMAPAMRLFADSMSTIEPRGSLLT